MSFHHHLQYASIIDVVLDEMAQKPNSYFYVRTQLGHVGEDKTGNRKFRYDEARGILEWLLELNVISHESPTQRITTTGIQVVKVYKGIAPYVAQLEKKDAEEAEYKRMLRVKEKNEAILAKWQKYTYWPVALLAAIGGIYSLCQLLELLKFNL